MLAELVDEIHGLPFCSFKAAWPVSVPGCPYPWLPPVSAFRLSPPVAAYPSAASKTAWPVSVSACLRLPPCRRLSLLPPAPCFSVFAWCHSPPALASASSQSHAWRQSPPGTCLTWLPPLLCCPSCPLDNPHDAPEQRNKFTPPALPVYLPSNSGLEGAARDWLYASVSMVRLAAETACRYPRAPSRCQPAPADAAISPIGRRRPSSQSADGRCLCRPQSHHPDCPSDLPSTSSSQTSTPGATFTASASTSLLKRAHLSAPLGVTK